MHGFLANEIRWRYDKKAVPLLDAVALLSDDMLVLKIPWGTRKDLLGRTKHEGHLTRPVADLRQRNQSNFKRLLAFTYSCKQLS